MQLMKAAINGKAPDRALLMKLMEQHEAREERMEEKRAKKKAEGSEDVDWDAEREAIQQRLLAVTGEYVQSLHPQLEDKS